MLSILLSNLCMCGRKFVLCLFGECPFLHHNYLDKSIFYFFSSYIMHMFYAIILHVLSYRFTESCMPVRYEDDRNAFYAVPDECTYYYWRANMFVYKCPTAEGTFFDRATQTFVTFDPNCTCPNSRSTTGTTTASTTTTVGTSFMVVFFTKKIIIKSNPVWFG